MLESLAYPISTQGGKNLSVETISRKEAIAWLAGIIDGEGCIHAFWAKQQKHMTGPGMRVNILIGGCHPRLISKVSYILKHFEIGFCYQAWNPVGGRKQAVSILVAGKERVAKLLRLVVPHLTEKREQADLAIELIDYRNRLAKCYGPARDGRPNLYEDPNVIALIQKIKDVKKEGFDLFSLSRRPSEVLGSQSSETIRLRLQLHEVMIESELHGDM